MLFQSLQARFRLQDFYMKLNSIGMEFLHMNWADMTRGSRKELSSALQQQTFKAYYHEDDAGHPYFGITVLGVLEDQQVLYDFITEVYGAPTLTADDETLMSHYQKYCLVKKADESPIAIWSHDPNMVVLVSDDDEQGKPERLHELQYIHPDLFPGNLVQDFMTHIWIFPDCQMLTAFRSEDGRHDIRCGSIARARIILSGKEQDRRKLG